MLPFCHSEQTHWLKKAAANNAQLKVTTAHTCSSFSREEPSGRKGRSMSEVTDRFGGR